MTSSKIKVKFCGFTNLEDVQKALEIEVDYLGFILAKNSPRSISLISATKIIKVVKSSRSRSKFVAVMQNPTKEDVEEVINSRIFDIIQFHGEETPEFLSKFGGQIKMWKVFSLDGEDASLVEKLEKYKNVAGKFLLDLPKNEGEKSFQAFETFEELRKNYDLILAGGVTLNNLELYLEKLNPEIVDLARGVEAGPGKKDVNKMRAVCQITKNELNK